MLVSERPQAQSSLKFCFGLGVALAFVIPRLEAASQTPSAAQINAWPGADLFEDGRISQLTINIEPSQLEALRKESRTFVQAMVQEQAHSYSNVAVHLKGSVGSFRAVDEKPALTLDFDRFNHGQRFHGLRRIHLNNSVEDPTYCNETLGSELFRRAGIPAPRVTRAIVALNGRNLGVYVLKEGFTEDFLSCYFTNISGNLFEPGEGHDVNQHLNRETLQAPRHNRTQLRELGEAALTEDLSRRWTRLQAVLDVDRFIRFMVLEVLICHRDGYSLARNNFRVYQDNDSGKLLFFPHGMDQLFGIPDLPWEPQMAGIVSRAILETPEGKQRYREEFQKLFIQLFEPANLNHRVAQLTDFLRPYVSRSDHERCEKEAAALKARIMQRHQFLQAALKQPEPKVLQFKNSVAELNNWSSRDLPADAKAEKIVGPDQLVCLHIQTSSDGFPSWGASAKLRPGRYRFEGKVRVTGAKPLGFGVHRGAGLRIAGRDAQSERLVGTSGWRLLSTDFEVVAPEQDTQFICELRASAGEAWFDCHSLRVLQLN